MNRITHDEFLAALDDVFDNVEFVVGSVFYTKGRLYECVENGIADRETGRLLTEGEANKLFEVNP